MRPRLDRAERRLKSLRADVLDVGLAGLDGRDLALVDIDYHHVLARLPELHCRRQPPVSETGYTDCHFGCPLATVVC
jgi:hypothetical protein